MNYTKVIGFALTLVASGICFTSCSDDFEEIKNQEEIRASTTFINKVVRPGGLNFRYGDWNIRGVFQIDLENRTAHINIVATNEKHGITIHLEGTITWIGSNVTSFSGEITDSKGNVLSEKEFSELFDILNVCLNQILQTVE